MHIVYRYIDNKDNIVKYVGITSRDLKYRIEEHKKLDNWVSITNYWRIEYFVVNTKSESEAWEAHLIALYKTYLWFNKAKKDWGLIDCFLHKPIDWNVYSDSDDVIDINIDLYPIVDDTENLVSELSIQLDFDIPIIEIRRLVSKRIITPLARTRTNRLLFWETDIEKVVDWLKRNE